MRFPIRRLLAVAGALVLPAVAQAQATISGRVTAEGGNPVVGASVFLEGLQIGAQTTEEGRYNILVPAARATGQTAQLTVRSIGYRPISQPVTLTSGATITRDFTLVVNPLRLGEVVVTGAGTETTRERLGSVINSVDSSLLRRSAEPQNVVSALSGKAPNVNIRTQSGEPGASASIKIRGATSVFGTNQPLFVVDGQPIDNTTISTQQGPADFPGTGGTVTSNRAADINPNDIESVDILKGAAAAAIYGARAANGVVLITTKKGRPGATRYSLQSTTNFDKIVETMPLQRTYQQGTSSSTAAGGYVNGGCTAIDCTVPGSRIASWGAALSGVPTYDHSEEIYDTGLTLDNNLTVSGGNDRTTFYLSGGLTNQAGVIVGPNNRYDRTTARLKATHQLFQNFTVGGNFSYADVRGKYVQQGSNTAGLLLGALRTPPEFNNQQYLDPETGLHRSYRFPNPSPNSLTNDRGFSNPFFAINSPGNNNELGRFIGNVNLEYTPFAALTLRYTLGGDYYNDQRLEALPLTTGGAPTGQVTRFDVNNLEIDHNLVGTLRHTFSPSINGSLTLGQGLNSRRFRSTWVQGLDLNAPEPLALQNTVNVQVPLEFRSLRHAESYFTQAELNLFDQIFLNAGVRNDGFSTFGAGNRRAWYPKAQIAWAFTNALGITEQRGLLSFGKLRASYGETGREPPVYATNPVFTTGTQFGTGYGDFINASQSGQGGATTVFTARNPELKPERNRETELGADFGFLDQRVDLGFTWYNKRSTEVILNVPVNPAVTGSGATFANAAEITNQGIELTLNARPITTPAFAWEIGLQFGRNNGNVESLAGAEFVSYNNEGFTGAIGSSTVGYAPGVVRGDDFIRCGRGLTANLDSDPDLEDIDAACGANFAPGAVFIASNGQPLADPTDRVVADPNPDWTGGINTSVRLFGRLRLSGLLDIREGGQMWNGTRAALYRYGTHRDTEVRNRTGATITDVPGFSKAFPNVAGPGVGTVAFNTPAQWQSWFTGNGGVNGPTALFVEDISFVKLRELSLSYTLDQPWVRSRLGMTSMDIRVAGRNLATWTDYTGLDPESQLGGAEYLTQGIDYFNGPLTRSFVISIGLNR